ncbi:MAG: hypothetical protein HYW24_03675 [Candidatus Aenigmarchaeota archaeon]|nr:hypothetical protein [Candidatus Aenigmarchaeota archaeon]
MEKLYCGVCGKKFKNSEALSQHNNSIHGLTVAAHEPKRRLATGKIVTILSIVLIVAIAGYFSISSITGRATEPGVYDEFAKCLADKGAVFYGSFQCSHCKTQKDLFGGSIEYVNYVECGPLGAPPTNKECVEAGIRAYPTWVINNIEYTGVQDLDKLSELANCPL